MNSRSPREQMLYNARLKMQRDETGRILRARSEGEAIGELVGRISLLRQLLGLPPWQPADFANLDTAQLGEQADDLQRQLREHGLPPG